jgi:hypothetical protein
MLNLIKESRPKRIRTLLVAPILGFAAAIGLAPPAQAHDVCAPGSNPGYFCVYRYNDWSVVAHWGGGDTNVNYSGDYFHDGSGLNDKVTRARNTSGYYMGLWEHSYKRGALRCVNPYTARYFYGTSFDNKASSHGVAGYATCG